MRGDLVIPGKARIVVRGTKPVLFGLRQAHSEATRDVQVRLEPPRVAVLSTFHYVNQGGSEFVVYRAEYGDHGLWVRPLAMFTETVEAGCRRVPRFERIGD